LKYYLGGFNLLINFLSTLTVNQEIFRHSLLVGHSLLQVSKIAETMNRIQTLRSLWGFSRGIAVPGFPNGHPASTRFITNAYYEDSSKLSDQTASGSTEERSQAEKKLKHQSNDEFPGKPQLQSDKEILSTRNFFSLLLFSVVLVMMDRKNEF
jgi:hypothetical protein